MIQTIFQDVRDVLRQLRKYPGFAATTILTLALGIGAATSLFSVIDATRLLPFAHQHRLVLSDTPSTAGFQQPWSHPSFLDARQQPSAVDTALFGALALGLVLLGIAASVLPARCAASINPTEALRAE